MVGSLAAGRRLIAVFLVIGALASAPLPVLAHAELASATPAPNVSVIEAPEALRITFTESIDPGTAAIEVLDSQGRVVGGLGPVTVESDGLTARIELPNLEPGVYTVGYQVVSTVDGHATAGIYAFLVDPTGAAAPPADSASSTSPSVDAATVSARWLALAAILVALGGLILWSHAGRPALTARGIDRRPPWSLTAVASLLAAAGVAAYLALSARPVAVAIGAVGTGIPLDVAGAFGWTPFAIAMRVAFLGSLAAAIVSLIGRRRSGNGPSALVVGLLLLVALAGMSLAGHAASAGGPAFAAVDLGHLLAVAAWLGALPAAFILARRVATDRRGLFAAILRGHGRVALIAVPVVALTGIANAPLVLGERRDLVASDYGNLLVAKAVLLSVAAGIGAVNHLALRGRGRAAVMALVGAELVVGAIAVSTAATMVTIQPASTRQAVLATAPVNPAHFFGEVGPSRVHLAVSLPAPGTQAYRVTVRDGLTGAPRADVQKVFLEFRPPTDSDLAPSRVELDADADDGLWLASGPYTPFIGDWELEVIVRREGERDEALPFELSVVSPGSAELGPAPETGIRVPAPLAAAWGLLPPGPLGWLPSVIALAALAALWRARPSMVRSAGRGAAVAVLLVATAAAGSRSLVTAANHPSATELEAQPALGSADLERGRQVYLANCASCHGTEGDGAGSIRTLPVAGPLPPFVRGASNAELSYRISYGVAGTEMPAFAGILTADERSDLITYLREGSDER